MTFFRRTSLSVFATAMCALMSFNSVVALSANAQCNDSEYGLGCLPDSETGVPEDSEDDYDNLPDRASLPTSVDLSSDAAFPPIGNQGSKNSCVAWATTYYAFTYMVHHAKNITSTYYNAYSPRWTYNLTNGGVDDGSTIQHALHVLEYQGAISMTDYPYVTSGNFFDWSHNTQAMIDALSTRISTTSYTTVPLTYSPTFLTKISRIKTGLNNHRVYIAAAYSTPYLNNASCMTCSDTNHNGEYIYVRNASTTSSGSISDRHAMAIVGYDDSVWCDVNNNNTVDAGETGAFKIANSWGNGWKNSGYVWVLYDSLLSTSQIMYSSLSSSTWDYSYPTTRCGFFSYEQDPNKFNYFSVSDYTVGYVSEIDLSTSRRNQLRASTYCKNSNNQLVENNGIYQFFSSESAFYSTPISFSGTIVLNHPCSSDLDSYLNGYTWGIEIMDVEPDNYSISGISHRIVDNLNNTICSTCSGEVVNGSTKDSSAAINLALGDVNYSGNLTQDDATLIMSYIAGNTDFSNVQKKLADFDGNGSVGISDVIALQQYLSNRGMDVSAIHDELRRYGYE